MQSNRILASLSYEDCARICPGLQKISIKKGEVLCHPYKSPDFVYFPLSALFSLSWCLKEDSSVFASLVGNEGIIGITALYEEVPMPYMATCLHQGSAMRISLDHLRKELKKSEQLNLNFGKYTHRLINQIGINIACSKSHDIKDQLAHFLLQSHDRISGSEILYTQEDIALMLGVRRERVGQAAILLQQEGKISYSRGHISILDAEKMKKECCPCYHLFRSELENLHYPANHSNCLNNRAEATSE